MATPCVGMEIVYQVAAADDQHAFIPKRCELLSDSKWNYGGLVSLMLSWMTGISAAG